MGRHGRERATGAISLVGQAEVRLHLGGRHVSVTLVRSRTSRAGYHDHIPAEIALYDCRCCNLDKNMQRLANGRFLLLGVSQVQWCLLPAYCYLWLPDCLKMPRHQHRSYAPIVKHLPAQRQVQTRIISCKRDPTVQRDLSVRS